MNAQAYTDDHKVALVMQYISEWCEEHFSSYQLTRRWILIPHRNVTYEKIIEINLSGDDIRFYVWPKSNVDDPFPVKVDLTRYEGKDLDGEKILMFVVNLHQPDAFELLEDLIRKIPNLKPYLKENNG